MTQMIPVNNNPFSAFDVPQFANWGTSNAENLTV